MAKYKDFDDEIIFDSVRLCIGETGGKGDGECGDDDRLYKTP